MTLRTLLLRGVLLRTVTASMTLMATASTASVAATSLTTILTLLSALLFAISLCCRLGVLWLVSWSLTFCLRTLLLSRLLLFLLALASLVKPVDRIITYSGAAGTSSTLSDSGFSPRRFILMISQTSSA